jgi:hypothetical protein
VAVGIVHPIADAQTIVRFTHNWANTHRAMSAGKFIPHIEKIFDPARVERHAADGVNANEPDPKIIAKARQLPIHHFDWWASTEGCPTPFIQRARVPDAIKESKIEFPALGATIPWPDWNLTAPISRMILHFTADEINSMYKAASEHVPVGVHLSRLDVLQAHLWIMLISARNLSISSTEMSHDSSDSTLQNMSGNGEIPSPIHDEHEEPKVYFTMPLNFRARLGLPPELTGTPAILVHACAPLKLFPKIDSSGALSESGQEISADILQTGISNTNQHSNRPTYKLLATLATIIRSSITAINAQTIPYYLYDIAHQIDTQRYWQIFPGKYHVAATAWNHHRIYEVDFVGNHSTTETYSKQAGRPRHVEPIMPSFMACIIEANAPQSPSRSDASATEGSHEQSSWYVNGADVWLHYETEVLERMLKMRSENKFF